MIREAAVAGTFYPATERECLRALDACFAQAEAPKEPGAKEARVGDEGAKAAAYRVYGVGGIEARISGGVVPHAGWMCSGMVAATVFSAMAANRRPDTVVVLGAVHRPRGEEGAIFPNGRWDTPLGGIEIDERLAERILGHTNLIVEDPYAHEPEHSIEVQVPFVQRVWPGAKLLPMMVPPSRRAVEIGDAVGRTLVSYGYEAVVLASSDLTHYGDRYGFEPKGAGEAGLKWAKEVNDRRVIDLMVAMEAERIVPEAVAHRNACGGGAIAATIAATKAMGAKEGLLLRHATSRETMRMERERNAVGYAGMVFVG